jgi:hypothetical protein
MLLYFILFFLSCVDSSLIKIIESKPEILVHPQELFFGNIESGMETGLETFTIVNVGNAPLHVDPTLIDGSTRFNIGVFENDQLVLQPGEILDVPVDYIPISYEHNGAVVRVLSNDEENKEILVLLEGYGDAPKIHIEPEYVDYGGISIGCDNEYRVTVKNIGNLDLEIENVVQMTTLPNDIDIDYGSLPDPPWVLLQNEEIDLLIKYVPTDIGVDESIVRIDSNDPINASLEIEQTGHGDVEHWYTQEWIQEEQKTYDILWIIDNSGSMNRFQSRLSQNMTSFMSYLTAGGDVDFRMGFITTDRYLLVDPFIDSNTINASLVAANAINNIGTQGSGNETGLQEAYSALSYFYSSGEFMRHDSTLIMIFVSDEIDHSPLPYNDYILGYINFKPKEQIKVYAVIGDYPAGCNSSNGIWNSSADFGEGYYDATQYYGGDWYSICETDWSSNMTNLAQDITVMSVFALDKPDPIESTIAVYINGQQLSTGWSYIPNDNWIQFDANNIPLSGQTLRIEYATYGCGDNQ